MATSSSTAAKKSGTRVTSVSFAPGAQAAHALAGLRPHHLERLAQAELAPQVLDVEVPHHHVGSVARLHPLERCEPQRALALGGMTGGRAGELLGSAAANQLVEGLR